MYILILIFSVFNQSNESIINDITYLSSDSLYGRGYSFNGHTKAANYIKARIIPNNVEPYFDKFDQYFDVKTRIFIHTPSLTINNKLQILGDHYLPFYSSGSGDFKDVELLYLGYGDIVKISKLDSIEGKIVYIKEHIPDSINSDKKNNTLYNRIKLLELKGVAAIIVQVSTLNYGINYGKFKIPVIKTTTRIPIYRTKVNISINVVDTTIKTQNVIGIKRGKIDSTIILMAHYDHLNAFNKNVYFPGANDNASGVSLLLYFCDFLKNKQLNYNIVFAFFSGEESGLIGSKYFYDTSIKNNMNIKFIINYDMVASGENGIMILGGNENPNDFNLFKTFALKHGINNIRSRKNSPISDHYFFLLDGVKGFYIYTLNGRQPYHHVEDKAETIQLSKLLEVKEISIDYLKHQNLWGITNE